MQLVSAMNQEFGTLENIASNIEQVLNQRIAQLLAYVQVQVDHLLGINVNTSSSAPNATVTQTSAGSSSSSGSTKAHTGPTADQNGTTTARAKPHDAAAPLVQPFDSSGDTDGSGTVGGSLAGNVGTGVSFNGTIGGGLSGTFSGTSFPLSSSFTSSASLSDGTTFSSTSGHTTFQTNAGTFTGTFSGTSTGSDGDSMVFSGTMSGTIDGGGNVSGSFTGTITVGDAVYTWDPTDSQDLANNPQNWLLNGFTQSASGFIPGTEATDTAAFDASVSNANIVWNQNFTFSTMQLGGTWGYTGQQTLDDGDALELTGVNGNSVTMDAISGFNMALGNTTPESMEGGSGLNAAPADSITKVQFDGAATLTNFNYTAAVPGAQLIINSGTTRIADNPGAGNQAYTENLGVQLVVNPGATLKDLGFNALNLTASNLVPTINGEMDVYYGTGAGLTLIQQAKNAQGQMASGCYIGVTGGTLEYIGSVGVEDTIAVPVLVQNSGNFTGNFTVTSTTGGGWLKVTGQVAQTQKYSVYMTSGFVNLSQASTLECDDDYQQTDGTLQTTDSSQCALQDGTENAPGTAIIAGGTLTINGGAGSGNLTVTANNLNFNGQFKVGVQGNNSGKNGSLNVSGSMNLQAGNLLTVVVNGQLNNGNWTIIDTGGNNIAQFNNPNFPVGMTQHPNQPKGGDYEVTSP